MIAALVTTLLGVAVGFAGSRGLRLLLRAPHRRRRPAPIAGSEAAMARSGGPAAPAPAPWPTGPPSAATPPSATPPAAAAPYPITINQPGRTPAPASPPSAVVRADTGERIELTGHRITIGRAADRAIAIDDTRVSRTHAELVRTEQGWSVVDTGSANGTLVGGRRLDADAPRALAVGDVISVGPVDLRVV